MMMQPPQIPIPLLGRQLSQEEKRQQEQAVAQEVVATCYLKLVPVVAAPILAQMDDYADRDQIPDRIAEEAWRITAAVVKRLGIMVPEKAPGGHSGR